jgi:hypothetical protein
VTRGLDPNVCLKPSGIDWLGNVPEHWQLHRLKSLVQNVNDQTNAKMPEEIYIALEHVESWTGRARLPNANVAFESQVRKFQSGDILFAKLRPYLSKVTRPSQGGVCVLKVFNDLFGNIDWKDADMILQVIAEEIPAKVAADRAYQNAMKYSDKQNARIEHDKALQRVLVELLADHTELFKQFSDNPDFKKWLGDTIFAVTYMAPET